MKKFAVCAVALFFVSMSVSPAAVIASANSAPAYWEGSASQGVVAADPACPVEVLHESLTLRVEDLPNSVYPDAEAFAEYRSSMTAEYTFYNPTETDLSVRLVFPLGARPEYAFMGDGQYFDDTARYGVTVDGESVPRNVRYLYSPYRSGFDATEIARLRNDKSREGIWTEEAICRTHVCDVDIENPEEYLVETVLSYNPERTAILVREAASWSVENGDLQLFLRADGSSSFVSFGVPPAVRSVGAVKKENAGEEAADLPASLRTEDTAFGEYAEACRPAQVSEVDWFHAYADCLCDRASRDGVIYFDTLSADDLTRWYDYTLEFPAGATRVNTVVAPLYPDSMSETNYYFTYLLSPARLWADFGELEITVLTDFEISDCSLRMEKTENGYYVKRQGLPLGEFTFSIYDGGFPRGGTPFFLYFWIGAFVLHVAAALIALVVVFAIRAAERRGK